MAIMKQRWKVKRGKKMAFKQIKLENIQRGSNMTGTDLCVNKPHCAASVRP